ncbi:MAG: hypothetical protein MI810_19995, partial [Flavobacteriales bacterium]|nr:hypothetical protein [Flavobacteriales bacterium]
MARNTSSSYNRVVLIGNGLDLSLGLKSRYSDFIVTNIKQGIISAINENTHFQSELFSLYKTNMNLINRNETIDATEKCETISEIMDIISKIKTFFVFEPNHSFFTEIISQAWINNWVDIESLYYKNLKKIFEEQKSRKYEDKNYSGLDSLNNCLSHISSELTKYLGKEQNCFNLNPILNKHKQFVKKLYRPHNKLQLELINKPAFSIPPEKVLFL